MFPRIMVTNGDAHPPEQWAVVTAEQLMPMDGDIAEGRRIEAMKLQAAIAEALMPHHEEAQTAERSKLKEVGDDHLDTPHDTTPHVDGAIDAIQAAARGTPWEAHWQKPEVVAAAQSVLDSHFETAKQIERHWYVSPEANAAERRVRHGHPRHRSEAAKEYHNNLSAGV